MSLFKVTFTVETREQAEEIVNFLGYGEEIGDTIDFPFDTRIEDQGQGSALEIHTVAVVSGGHISPPDATAVELGKGPHDNYPYGVRVYIGGEDTDDWPDSARAICQHARSLGCKWIEFDQDGERYDGFPVYCG